MPQPAIAQTSDATRLPRAVRDQAERIRLLTEPQAPDPSPENPPSSDPAANAPTPPVDPGQQPAADPDPSLPPIESLDPGFVYDPNDPRLKSSNPRASDPSDVDYWRQRFLVESGFRTRDTEALRAKNADTQRRLDEAQAEIRTLKASPPASAPAATSSLDIKTMLTPEQLEQIDEEQFSIVAEAAQRVAQAEAQKLIDAELRPLREEREEQRRDTAASKQRSFLERLAELTPDYETLDAMPKWLEWLALDDPASGVQRQQLLDHHKSTRNADRISKMFEAFRATLPGRPTPPVTASGRTGAAPGGQPRPGPSKGRPTEAEIRDFHKRAATKRPGQQGYVTDEERKEFYQRMELPQSRR